jgi:hypothetical protein
LAGLIGFASIYFNGVLALLFVFVLPGLVFVRAFSISNFPQRWFVVFLSSLTANHLLVSLIAALHLDPLQTYRAAAAALIAILILLIIKGRAGSQSPAYRGVSTILLSDVGWLVFGLVFLGFTYINVWKHGVPNIFEGGDVSISWNTWSLIWSQGKFPTSSIGYPQFVPTIWAVTYIFTGSTEQYFAFYIYIFWIVVPIVLNAMNLGRLDWWQPLAPGLAFIWLIAEIQDPWLRACLPQACPDWVAAIFAFSGVVLFVASAPKDRFDSEKITAALISLCLLLIAAATKPQYGLFTAAVFIAVCTDAAKYLQPGERTRLTIVAVALVSAFAAAYAIYFLHLTTTRIPDYSLPMSERLPRALMLLNTNFSLPFRILVFAGLALSPFVTRVRWLALPLVIGFSSWALMLSYDLRNLLGLLLISAFIPLFALVRALAPARDLSGERRWSVPDGAVACGLAILVFGLTSSLAQGDKELKQRFATEQLTKSAGLQINQKIEQLVLAGCTIFNADNYLHTISAFARFQDQIIFFFSTLPLDDALTKQVNQASGCTGFFYPPDRTHPSILDFISSTAKARNYAKVIEGRGMELLVSSASPPSPR